MEVLFPRFLRLDYLSKMFTSEAWGLRVGCRCSRLWMRCRAREDTQSGTVNSPALILWNSATVSRPWKGYLERNQFIDKLNTMIHRNNNQENRFMRHRNSKPILAYKTNGFICSKDQSITLIKINLFEMTIVSVSWKGYLGRGTNG